MKAGTPDKAHADHADHPARIGHHARDWTRQSGGFLRPDAAQAAE